MKHYSFWIIGVGFCILLFSCKIGESFSRPELNLPSQFESVEEVGKDTLSIDFADWRSIYTDSVLQGLIERALEHNKDVLTAAARVKEMMANKRIKYADMFPSADLGIYGNDEVMNYGGHARDEDPEFSGTLRFSWELDLWGNLRWANESAIASYMESVEARRALCLTIIAEVAQNYFELNALDRELSIVKQTVAARREAVRLTKLRFEGGLTSETPFRQSEVELAKTETLVPDLERQIRLKENDLSFLLGDYPKSIVRGRSLRLQQMPKSLPPGLPSMLLERRPDIRGAEQRLRAAHANVGVAFTDMFPKIRLTGNFGLESDALSNFIKSPYWFVAGDLLSPIFAMGKNRAKHRAAKAVYEQEVYQYQKDVLNAFKEVNNALITFKKVKEMRESREQLEKAAHAYLELATLQYLNGVISYIDVLDAQRGLFDAQIGLNESLLEELLSVVSLYKALGGGFQP